MSDGLERVPVEAITRAQARTNVEVQTEAEIVTSETERLARKNYWWRNKRQKRVKAKKKPKETQLNKDNQSKTWKKVKLDQC